MICDEQEVLLVAYLHGELSAEEQAELEGHLATCDGCAGRLEEYRAVREAVLRAEPPAIAPSPEAGEGLMATASDLLRGRRHPPIVGRLGHRPAPRRLLVGAAAAVAVLALVGFFLLRPPTQGSVHVVPRPVETAINPARVPEEVGFPVLLPDNLPADAVLVGAVLRTWPGMVDRQVELIWQDSIDSPTWRLLLREGWRGPNAPLAGVPPAFERLEVRGQEGYVFRETVSPAESGLAVDVRRTLVTWFEGDVQYMLEGYGIPEGDLLRIADSLYPTTQ